MRAPRTGTRAQSGHFARLFKACRERGDGNTIRLGRRTVAWDQHELVDELGYAERTIRNWETGATLPASDALFDIATLFSRHLPEEERPKVEEAFREAWERDREERQARPSEPVSPSFSAFPLEPALSSSGQPAEPVNNEEPTSSAPISPIDANAVSDAFTSPDRPNSSPPNDGPREAQSTEEPSRTREDEEFWIGAEEDFADTSPINITTEFDRINLYSDGDSMRNFDTAVRLHSLTTARGIQGARLELMRDGHFAMLPNDTLSIVTFSSRRAMFDPHDPGRRNPNFPFYVKRGKRRYAGLQINSEAHVESRYDQRRWIADNQRTIETALRNGAQVICLGELDYPFVDTQGSALPSTESYRLNVDHRDWIRRTLVDANREIVLFAGSSHCWSRHGTCANIGRLFIAERNTRSRQSEIRIRRLLKRVSTPTFEGRSVRKDGLNYHYYGTSSGNIAVLMSTEVCDPGLLPFMSINSNLTNIDRLQLILVPSYSQSRLVLRSCQQLSYLGNCAVVYVNALGHVRQDPSQVFVSGVSLRTLQEQAQQVAEMVRSGIRPDPRMFDRIHGLRNLAGLVQFVDLAHRVQVNALDPSARLLKWDIPQGFLPAVANIMNAKYPSDRRRILSHI